MGAGQGLRGGHDDGRGGLRCAARPGHRGDGPRPRRLQRRAAGRGPRARPLDHHRPRPAGAGRRLAPDRTRGLARAHPASGGTRGRPRTAARRRRRHRRASADSAGASTTEVAGGSVYLQPVAIGSGARRRHRGVRARGEIDATASAWPGRCSRGVAPPSSSARSPSPTGWACGWCGPPGGWSTGAHDLGEGQARRTRARGRAGRTAPAAVGVQLDGRPGRATARERAGAGRRPVPPAADAADRAAAERRLARRRARRRADPGRGRRSWSTRSTRSSGPPARPSRRPTAPGRAPAATRPRSCRERMAFWSALAEDEGRKVRVAGVERPVRDTRGPRRPGRRRSTPCSATSSGTPRRAPPSRSTCTTATTR